jgi:hypothetical protein
MRCGTSGTSWHVTAKSSFCVGVCFINLAPTRRELCALPREICPVFGASRTEKGERSLLTAGQKSAEGIVEVRASKARTV